MIHKYKQNDTYILLDVNSGSVHIIDEMIFDILDYFPDKTKEETVNILSDKYKKEDLLEGFEDIEYLIENDQLFTDDQYIKNLEFINRKPVIKAMCLHIAHDCNIRCRYCFASQGDFEGDRSLMSLEVGKKSLKFLVENSGNRRNLEVDFFGGEPLMNFDVVKELVSYGRSLEKEYNKHFRFTITTNGVLLTKDKIDYINENMDNVVLSIDGRPKINDLMRYTISGGGTYDIIVPKFQELVKKRKNKNYYVRGTFTKFNKDFKDDVLHLVDLGFKSTSIEPVVGNVKEPYTFDETDLPEIFKQYDLLADELVKRNKTDKDFSFFHFNVDLSQGPCIIKRMSGCGAGSEYVAITPEGDIYPCHQFVGDEEFKIGNILENTYDNFLSHEFKEAHVYSKEKCKTCWAKFYCSGGCHANAYQFNNDIRKPYDLGCEMEKKRIECSLYIQSQVMEEK